MSRADHALFVRLRHSMYKSAQRHGWKELWGTWVERWGEVKAKDALICAMAEYEAKYNDLKDLVAQERKREAREAGA